MNFKKLLIIFGTVLSVVLLILVFSRLDWSAFFTAMKTIRLPQVLLAGCVVMLVIALHSLRWNLVARLPLTKFKNFWQAVNIGYLGNIIYPARAGEVLRIVAIHHFAPLVLARAVTSSVIDRMLDMIMVGILTLLVLWIHGNRVDPNIGRSVIGIFIVTTMVLTLLTIFAASLHAYVQRWLVEGQWQRKLQEWLLHGLEDLLAFRKTHNVLIVLLISACIFLLDSFWMWQIMAAFHWDLPFEAGLTVCVFVIVATSLPSAPGYIGIYQVACVLALGLYGIDESFAVAYSIVLQLLGFTIIGVQGMLVTTYCGFNFSREQQKADLIS